MSDTMINDADLVPVSADDLPAVERFLFRESRLRCDNLVFGTG